MSDTISQLEKALRPGGIQRIPFPLESYQHPSLPLSAKQLVNLYAEQAPADARTQAALLSTPGMELFQTLAPGPIVAVNGEFPGRIYVASGDKFYRIRFQSDGVFTDDLGVIGTPGGATPSYLLMTTIAVGPTACVVCVPPNAFTCGHDVTQPLNPLGGTFPGNATSVAYLDGYFGFTSSDNLQQFFISRLLDPSDFDALDFASADGIPNTINMIVSLVTDFWLIGHAGLEVWYDSGNQDFPFRRRAGGVLVFPDATPRSVSKADGSIFWVGLSDVVYRTRAYGVERISTHAIEAAIRELGSGGNVASALTYWQDGHVFYAINFPGRTLVYDLTTGKWHDRVSAGYGGRWRANAASLVSDQPLVGDATTGELFFLRQGLGTEDGGGPMLRQMVTPPVWAATKRAFCPRLEVEMEVGGALSPGDVTLDWSDDGGWNWTGGPRTLNTGTASERRKRVFTTRLGSFRQRVHRLTTQGVASIYAMDADITAGTS